MKKVIPLLFGLWLGSNTDAFGLALYCWDANGTAPGAGGPAPTGTWGVDPDGLAACFPEFRPYLDRCRFDDCRHLAEPCCAVRAAVTAGRISGDRLVSY